MDCHPYVSALPIFPGRRQPSIFGASELNCRVRNGNGWTLTAISTDYSISQSLGSIGKPTKCSSMEMRKQRREPAFTLAWKRAIRSLLSNGDPYESRTRVCGVRGRRLNHLTNGPSSLWTFSHGGSASTLSQHSTKWGRIWLFSHPALFSGSRLGTHTQAGVVHLQGLEPWTP